MFSPKYGLFGMIIYPAHFSMMIVCPIFIAIGSVSLILLLVAIPDMGIILLFSLILLMLFLLLIKKELIINFIQLEIVLLQAIRRAFTDKDPIIYIDKIESTRRN